jgi:ArsR family transcriptional regulator
MIDCQRRAQWMVYSLPENPSPLLAKNLACLQDCCREETVFKKDAARLEKLIKNSDCLPTTNIKP